MSRHEVEPNDYCSVCATVGTVLGAMIGWHVDGGCIVVATEHQHLCAQHARSCEPLGGGGAEACGCPGLADGFDGATLIYPSDAQRPGDGCARLDDEQQVTSIPNAKGKAGNACRATLPHIKPCGPAPIGDPFYCACGCTGADEWCYASKVEDQAAEIEQLRTENKVLRAVTAGWSVQTPDRFGEAVSVAEFLTNVMAKIEAGEEA